MVPYQLLKHVGKISWGKLRNIMHFFGATSPIIACGGNNHVQITDCVTPIHAMLAVMGTYSNDVAANNEVVARKFVKIVKKSQQVKKVY